jgi:hypothetical protein
VFELHHGADLQANGRWRLKEDIQGRILSCSKPQRTGRLMAGQSHKSQKSIHPNPMKLSLPSRPTTLGLNLRSAALGVLVIPGGLAVLMLAGCTSTPSTGRSSSTAPTSQNPDRPELAPLVARAARQPLTPPPGEGWQPMFDGRTFAGWRETKFSDRSGVSLRDRLMLFGEGDPLTGVNWTNPPPRMNYEITLEAMRLAGHDFFCALTFPVGTNSCTFVVGGWSGSVVGISSIDNADASENETTRGWDFETGRWYRMRVRVTPGRIEAWIDSERVVNVDVADRQVSMRSGDIEMSAPLGIATYITAAAFRDIRFRPIEPRRP